MVDLPLPLLLPSTTSDVMQLASFVCLFLCDCRSVCKLPDNSDTYMDRVDFEERFYSAGSSWDKEGTAIF